MKTMFTILALSLHPMLAIENPVSEDPFAVREIKPPPAEFLVSKLDLKAGQSLREAIQQITSGLSPAARKKLVVDIPDEELGKMLLTGDMRLRDVHFVVALKILEKKSPIGVSFRYGVWHISTERPDDIIAVEYGMRKSELVELGIRIEPNGMLLTKSGGVWPSGSGEWKAEYTAGEPDEHGIEIGKLRVLATRSFHDEIAAVLLLKAQNYNGLLLGR